MNLASSERVLSIPALTARGRKLFRSAGRVNSRGRVFLLLATSLAATSCIRVPRAVLELPAGDWVTRQGNTERAAFADERVPESVRVVWEEGLGRGVQATPIVNEGLIVAVVTGGSVVTASTSDGDIFWSRRYNGSVAGQALRVGPRLFFATQHREGSAYAIDVRRGRRLWERELDARATSEPAFADSAIYVATDKGEVLALDVSRGGVLWRTRLGGVAVQPPIVSGNSLLLLTGGTLVSVERGAGKITARHALAGPATAPLAVRGDTVVLVTHSGTVAAYAELGARELWRHDVATPILAAPVMDAAGVFVLARDGRLFRADASGARLVADLDGTATESLTLTADGLLVGLLEGVLVFVRRDGTVVWRQEVNGSVRAPAAVHDGSIYVATLRGKLIKLTR